MLDSHREFLNRKYAQFYLEYEERVEYGSYDTFPGQIPIVYRGKVIHHINICARWLILKIQWIPDFFHMTIWRIWDFPKVIWIWFEYTPDSEILNQKDESGRNQGCVNSVSYRVGYCAYVEPPWSNVSILNR